ncbi:MFS transporter [Legionella tunisiensis]|uniref:MFS transporter n=1 Tax=Legionella tunisiensis TaxID=1034944 RepID=UPI0002D5D396|nr:MFS transporter [Legionella tunisiensis]
MVDFFTTGLLLLLMNIDMTAVNLALAPIAVDLHLGIINVQWIISAYLIGGASMVMLGGLLGDVYGHRKIFIYGAIIFTLASVGVGGAANQWVIISMRLLQGIGAALAWPLAIVIVRNSFYDQEGLAMGLVAAVMAISMSIGPPVGGLILYWLNWRWIFLINLPLGILVIGLAYFYLPQDSNVQKQETLHIKSAILLISSLLFLTLFLNGGQSLGFGSWIIITALLLSSVSFITFIWLQKTVANPLIDLTLFQNKALASCFGVRFFWQVIWIGLFLILSLYFQNVKGFSSLHTSLYFLSLTVSYALISPFGGRLTERFSARTLILAGISLSLIPLLWLVFASSAIPLWQWIMIFILYGVSTAIVFPSLLNATLALAPAYRRGMVSGVFVFNVIRRGALWEQSRLGLPLILLHHTILLKKYTRTSWIL